MNNQKYYLAAITAFIIWGFFPLELRLLKQYSAGQILYFRILFSFILLVMLAILRKDIVAKNITLFKGFEKKKQAGIILLTLIGGLFISSNWLIFIYVVNHISIKTASFSYFICPVITAVLAYFIIKEHLSKIQWISVALCILSCVLIGFYSIAELYYSCVIATTYALYLISQRRNLEFDRLLILTIQIAFALLLLTPFYSSLVVVAPKDLSFYFHTFLIAILFTIIPLFLNLFALKGLKSATIGVLMYLNPIVGFAIAFLFYQENSSLLQVAGYVLIVIAVLMFNYKTIGKRNVKI